MVPSLPNDAGLYILCMEAEGNGLAIGAEGRMAGKYQLMYQRSVGVRDASRKLEQKTHKRQNYRDRKRGRERERAYERGRGRQSEKRWNGCEPAVVGMGVWGVGDLRGANTERKRG